MVESPYYLFYYILLYSYSIITFYYNDRDKYITYITLICCVWIYIVFIFYIIIAFLPVFNMQIMLFLLSRLYIRWYHK